MQRPSTQSAAAFVQMLRAFRPCPQCGSGRVTVQQSSAEGGLVARCSDCGAQHKRPEAG